MQKKLYISGLILSSLSSFLLTPFLVRFLDQSHLYFFSMAVLFQSMFGVLDFARPLVVRKFISNSQFASYTNVIGPSLKIAPLMCVLFFAFCVFMFGSEGLSFGVSLTLALLLFLIYTPLWGVLEGALQQGMGYFIRSTSIFLLYLFSALGALGGKDWLVVHAILISNAICAILFFIASKKYFISHELSYSGQVIEIKEIIHVFSQNISKLINDFGDRLLSAYTMGTNFSTIYNINQDIASRSNVFSQILSSYYYPIICKDHFKENKLILIASFVSISITTFAWMFYFFLNEIYILYFGAVFENGFVVFCLLLYCFGLYSLSFFGQAVLRSRNLDLGLSISFSLSTILGVTYIVYNLHQVSVSVVLMGAMLFKSSGVFMIMGLRYLPKTPLLCYVISALAAWTSFLMIWLSLT